MAYLGSLGLEGQGCFKVLSTLDYENQRVDMVAVLWFEKNRCYFVGNSEGTAQVEPMYRTYWCQVSEELNAEPDHVYLEIPDNKMIKTYYGVCAEIYRHNRQLQDNL